MKRMMQLLLVAFVTLTSAFFVYNKEAEVEAAHCKLGQYINMETKKCQTTKAGTDEKERVKNISQSFINFVNAIIYLSSGIALIMIIYAGFQYTMSEGDPYKIQEAKTYLIRAGIGMLISFSTFNILSLVVSVFDF